MRYFDKTLPDGDVKQMLDRLAAAQELSEEQVKQCEHEADMEMIKRAPKIGEPRKLRYDCHVERRQILTERLNALLRFKAGKEKR